MIVFFKRDKILRYIGEERAVCSRIRVCVIGQHDRRVELLAGQDVILAGQCSLTGRYSPCTKVIKVIV